jgi:hypothetical protein
MLATLTQSGNEPGATIYLRTVLTEYGQPLTAPCRVRAEVVYPDESQAEMSLVFAGPGAYEGALVATQSGVYRFRLVAEGTTMRGRRFTREQLRTGAVWLGGNRPPRPPADPDRRFCHFLQCLLKQKGVWELLRKNGIDPRELARCLEGVCRNERSDDQLTRVKALLGDDRILRAIADELQTHGDEHD